MALSGARRGEEAGQVAATTPIMNAAKSIMRNETPASGLSSSPKAKVTIGMPKLPTLPNTAIRTVAAVIE